MRHFILALFLYFFCSAVHAQRAVEENIKPGFSQKTGNSNLDFLPSEFPPLQAGPRLIQFPNLNMDSKQQHPIRSGNPQNSNEQYGQGKQLENAGNLHVPNRWYALENEQNETYWNNVLLDKILIQFAPSTNFHDQEIVSFLASLGIVDVLDSSMFPQMQQFAVYAFPPANKLSMLSAIKACKAQSLIEFAEPLPIISKSTCYPNDPAWNLMQQCWGHFQIYADSLYCYLNQPTRQRVGVIDDAIDWFHSDLYDVVWYGYDYANQDNDPTPDNSVDDHGTHVTGLSSAKINNNYGISGVVNDTVRFAKVADYFSSFSTSAIINAINAFASDSKLKTFNMSFGSYVPNAAEESAINTAWNNGKLPIAAAGNDISSNPFYPAAFTNVVSVSAIGKSANGNLIDASYSNYGNWISVSAPGGELNTNWGLLSTLPSNTFGYFQGTSMAAPLVTGVAAAIFDSNPFLTAAQARSILQSQVIDLGTPGYDVLFGTGMVCAPCAFIEACNQMMPTLSASASTLCAGSGVQLSTWNSFNATYQWFLNGQPIAGANQATYYATNPGSYYVYVQSLGGCYNYTNSLSLTLIPSPVANFQYNVSGSTVSFAHNASNASSYFWNFGDGNSSTQPNPVHTYAQGGNYTVTLTVSNSCGSNSSTKTVQVNTSGLPSGNINPSFALHPNPADAQTSIQCHIVLPTDVKITIINHLGQSIWSDFKSMVAGEFDYAVPTAQLPAGLYQVQVNTQQTTRYFKLLVQH